MYRSGRGSKKETSLSTYQKYRSINARTKRGESKDQSRRVTADMTNELIATRERWNVFRSVREGAGCTALSAYGRSTYV